MSAVGTGLALAGTLLIALAGVGILRLPDVYGRLNAAAKAAKGYEAMRKAQNVRRLIPYE